MGAAFGWRQDRSATLVADRGAMRGLPSACKRHAGGAGPSGEAGGPRSPRPADRSWAPSPKRTGQRRSQSQVRNTTARTWRGNGLAAARPVRAGQDSRKRQRLRSRQMRSARSPAAPGRQGCDGRTRGFRGFPQTARKRSAGRVGRLPWCEELPLALQGRTIPGAAVSPLN